MSDPVNRRDFIRNSVLASTALAAAGAGAADAVPAVKSAAPKNLLPTGKLGNLQVTRLILGGNLLTRYQHSRDLAYVRKLVKSYNTDDKVRETIELAEASGINTLSVNVTPAVMKTLADHRKNGGTIQTILYSTANIEDAAVYGAQLRQMVDAGSEAIYIWGEQTDKCFREGKMALLRTRLEEARMLEVPCGIGAHELQAVQQIEKEQWPVDFYIKTFHHHRYPSAPRPGEAKTTTCETPGYWCRNPEETLEFMKTIAKPWIAFKVMAAGAIPPGDAFPYAFANGADFVLAGMFDFDIAEDCRLTREAVAKTQTRVRPWRA